MTIRRRLGMVAAIGCALAGGPALSRFEEPTREAAHKPEEQFWTAGTRTMVQADSVVGFQPDEPHTSWSVAQVIKSGVIGSTEPKEPGPKANGSAGAKESAGLKGSGKAKASVESRSLTRRAPRPTEAREPRESRETRSLTGQKSRRPGIRSIPSAAVGPVR